MLLVLPENIAMGNSHTLQLERFRLDVRKVFA